MFFVPAAEDQAVLAENAHYVETVLAILRFNASRQTQAASSNTKAYLALSKNSSFSRWTTSWNHKASNNDLQSMLIPDDEGAPQRLLKSILLGAPSSSSHPSYKGADAAVQSSPEPRDDGEGTSRSRRAPPVQPAELSASHVLKERRRREKLNERFVMLRSLVPFVTKVRCESEFRSNASSFTVVFARNSCFSPRSPVRRWTGRRSWATRSST